jgi:hypothetical protein
MKTRKSITIASNGRDSQFVTQASKVPKRGEAGEKASSPDAVLGSKFLGRSYRSNEKDDRSSSKLVEEVASSITNLLNQEDEPVEKADSNVPTSGDSLTNVGGGGVANSTISSIVSQNSLINVMRGIVPEELPHASMVTVNEIYRDMFYHDATCGTATELMSTLPFSDFSLSGLKDQKMARPFIESIESINAVALLPNISNDYIALGAALSTFTWDESKGVFVGASPHSIDHATFQQVPVFGFDPVITIQLPEKASTILKDPALLERYKEFIPEEMIKASGGWTLDPKTTIFIPRRALLKDYRGVSMYKRALPAWLYEKALMRGTLDQVYKRQRAVSHITMEGTEDWQPDSEEMQSVANLFMAADLDPLGAVVVTRSGINVNEVRRGDDFWRWDQNFDAIERIKLRALGISDQFASGEVTYNTMEQALTLFLEQIREYRARITREVFMDKMFPMIAEKHGFTAKKYKKRGIELSSDVNSNRIYTNEDDEMMVQFTSEHGFSSELRLNGNAETAVDARGINYNISDYVIPDVIWHKQLKPEADSDYLALLGTLNEQGVPISMRTWIAAGGLNADRLLEGLDEDIRMREQIAEWRKKLNEINKAASPEDGMGGMSDEFANMLIAKKLGIGGTRPTSILGRSNPDDDRGGFTDFDSRGNRRLLTKQGRDVIANRFNKRLAEAAAEVARKENHQTKKESQEFLEDKPKVYYSKD